MSLTEINAVPAFPTILAERYGADHAGPYGSPVAVVITMNMNGVYSTTVWTGILDRFKGSPAIPAFIHFHDS
jgi:hypothetical protein